ncbi:MAG TPA: hypothetical protein VFE80_17070, partial [Beijerinckiaceae bacterium]|nr:hypothetical protein [Beijerinckiaceae bacterium]
GERRRYPLLRFPWRHTEKALRAQGEYAARGEPIELDYVNPETGDSCLPTMGFTAMMLRPKETARPALRSSSAVFHVVEGAGRSTINGESFAWTRGDTFSAPVFATVEHVADGEAFLIRIHDAPLQQKLGFYEERERA